MAVEAGTVALKQLLAFDDHVIRHLNGGGYLLRLGALIGRDSTPRDT